MTALSANLDSLLTQFPAAHDISPATLACHAVHDITPRAVLQPESAEEAAACLRICHDHELGAVVRGNGTAMATGPAPQRLDLVLSTARLNGLREHDAENLSAWVAAGTTVFELQTELAREGQFLPVSGPAVDQRTVGGVAATDVHGLRRLRYGAPRDIILGLQVALADGRIIRSGGKTMKNVSGYDLKKLFIGSFGTVGMITEVCFRLLPIPATSVLLTASFGDPSVAAAAQQRLRGSVLEPAALGLLNPPAAAALGVDGRWVAVAGFEGRMEAVPRWEREVRSLWAQDVQLQEDGAAAAIAGIESAAATGTLTCTASVPLTQGPEVALAAAEFLGGDCRVSVGSGTVWLAVDGLEADGALRGLTRLRERVHSAGGFVRVDNCPAEWLPDADVWDCGAIAGIDLMRRLKASYDPRNVFAPGRFL